MTLLIGLLVVLLSVVLALARLMLARRLVPSTFFESRPEASYTIYSAIAIVYGVTVGFAILLVWQELNEAERTTHQEATSVEALYRLADQLPESDRNRVQEFDRTYAQVVVEEEWPLMAKGQTSSRAQSAAEELRRSIQELEPQKSALYSQMLTKIDDLYENRENRLLETQEGVPPFVWVVLLITGILTVAFTYLFDLKSSRVHVMRVAALTVAVSLSLYTVSVVEYPFSGDVQVGPEAFEMVLARI